MIKLTIEECKKFKINKVDFLSVESKNRKKNVNMIQDLFKLMNDKECERFFINIDSSIKIPEKIISFYSKYINNDEKFDNSEDINKMSKKILNSIQKEINDLKKKIKNFSKTWELDYNYVYDNLKNNPLLLITFAKDPNKQTIHQHCAAEWIKTLPFIEDFKEAPAGGKNAFYIVKGIVVNNKKNKKTEKSIDFIWNYTFKDKQLQFYATHKYTKNSGGSQDNQYNDVKAFHNEAKECIDNNICLLSITDGEYYLRKISGTNNSKLDCLNTIGIFRGPRNYATNCNRLVNDICIFIEKWLKDNFKEEEIKEELEKLHI